MEFKNLDFKKDIYEITIFLVKIEFNERNLNCKIFKYVT